MLSNLQDLHSLPQQHAMIETWSKVLALFSAFFCQVLAIEEESHSFRIASTVQSMDQTRERSAQYQ